MPSDCIAFRDTHYFSSLICDYLDETPEFTPFYNRFPNIENFKAQIDEKQLSFRAESRNLLSLVLLNQYKGLNTSKDTLANIEALKSDSTFTVTTGHQLNLFTGPLYFLYKIISAINLSKELKQVYPEYHFVPVYWMASEDHDFEEINYFNFKGQKTQWNREASGAVGELDVNGLDKVFEVFSSQMGNADNANRLRDLFTNTYLKHKNLADATRFLANELFKDYGLVIVDANNRDLKQLFIPHIKQELLKQTSFLEVSKTNKQLKDVSTDYKIQVNPRAINLFYLSKGLRERIIENEGVYSVNNTHISWSKEQLILEVETYPERFSPNVILRPLYQEVILPNLCYIGGGGELAYWFQLRENFKAFNVPFPILLLRNSVLIKTEKQSKKLETLNISNKDLFLKRDSFINKKVRQISNIDIDFSSQIQHLEEQFKDLYLLAEQTDKSFLGAVKAQEVKQIKGLKHLEKRLLKAQKQKLADEVMRITEIKNELFPNNSLQERQLNFSEVYLEYGDLLITTLVKELQPMKLHFLMLTI